VPVVRERLPGGHLPDHGKLLTDTFAEFGESIGPYLLAGLGQTLVIVPVTLVGVFGIYVCAGGSAMGALVAGAMVAESVEASAGSGVGGIVALIAALAPAAVAAVALFLVIGMMAAIMAPISASMTRAVAEHQRGDGRTLDISASFSTLMQEPGKVITVALMQTALAFVALPFCILPALVVGMFTWFAAPLAALHDISAREALSLSVRHVREHLTWHAVFFALFLGLGFIAANIPVLGPAFLVALCVRAHRELFGDGEQPVGGVVTA
jgi:hypothetical protein